MTKLNDILYPKSLREVWQWKEEVSRETLKSSETMSILNEKQNIKKIAKILKLRIYGKDYSDSMPKIDNLSTSPTKRPCFCK